MQVWRRASQRFRGERIEDWIGKSHGAGIPWGHDWCRVRGLWSPEEGESRMLKRWGGAWGTIVVSRTTFVAITE